MQRSVRRARSACHPRETGPIAMPSATVASKPGPPARGLPFPDPRADSHLLKPRLLHPAAALLHNAQCQAPGPAQPSPASAGSPTRYSRTAQPQQEAGEGEGSGTPPSGMGGWVGARRALATVLVLPGQAPGVAGQSEPGERWLDGSGREAKAWQPRKQRRS